jgi:hypothetical protein
LVSTTTQPHVPALLQSKLVRSVLVAEVLALVYWLLALNIRAQAIIPVWYDQQMSFAPSGAHLADPYTLPIFMNPPWTAVFLAPLAWLSTELAVLIQLCLYFAMLAALIVKYGGGVKHTLIALSSFIAFDSSLELNVEWLLALGLLVPVRWSMPFLLVKPQVLLGYYLGCKPREVLQAALPAIGVFGLSFLLWGWWPVRMLEHIQQVSPESRNYNVAPQSFLSAGVAIVIGIWLAVVAFRKRDVVVGILAFYFFTPYVALYSLLILFSLVAARWPRFALLISIVMWVVYGGTIGLALLRR